MKGQDAQIGGHWSGQLALAVQQRRQCLCRGVSLALENWLDCGKLAMLKPECGLKATQSEAL